MNNQEDSQDFQNLVRQLQDTETEDFFELARLLDLDPIRDFAGADLSSTNLENGNLAEANLCEADLSGANLSNANLSRANLSFADLSGSNLRYSNLSEANLSGANLAQADFSEANLYKVDFRDANLAGAIFSNNRGISEEEKAKLRQKGVFFSTLNTTLVDTPSVSSTLSKVVNQKRALITGITGQDGSYLSEFLLEKGYEVHGIIRRTSTFNTDRIDHIYEDPHSEDARLFLHYGDLTDGTTLRRILEEVQPSEIYNLGAQSHVRVSFDSPEYTVDSVGMGTLRLLEAVRDYQHRTSIQVRFYQASSSEMYGKVQEVPQKETTPFYPRSPYACAKVYAYWQTVNYRESYNLFACNGILFNHESPRRGETFVTRKITRALARIVAGQQKKLYMGNLDSKRDWGYAKDYVRAMWLMLQQEQPDDYVVATGETHSVQEFLDLAFGYVNLNWQDYVEFDERYLRPTEVDLLIGDASKAKAKLGWEPSVTFEQLVCLMVDADLKALGLIPLNSHTLSVQHDVTIQINTTNFVT